MRRIPVLLLIAILGQAVSGLCCAQQEFKVPAQVEELLDFNCYSCHGGGMKKGGVQLDHLDKPNPGQRSDLLNLALEHVYSGEMPPKKADQEGSIRQFMS